MSRYDYESCFFLYVLVFIRCKFGLCYRGSISHRCVLPRRAKREEGVSWISVKRECNTQDSVPYKEREKLFKDKPLYAPTMCALCVLLQFLHQLQSKERKRKKELITVKEKCVGGASKVDAFLVRFFQNRCERLSDS